MKSLYLSVGFSLLVTLAAYGWLSYCTPVAKARNSAAAMVTLSDSRTDCTVQQAGSHTAREIACREVGSYLQNTLNLRSQAKVAITASGQVSPDAWAALSNALYVHGFEVAVIIGELPRIPEGAGPPPSPLTDTGAPIPTDCDGVPAPCSPNPPQGISMAPGTNAIEAMQNDGPGGIARAGDRAYELYRAKRYQDLDNLIARYAKLHDRIDDGRFKLSGIPDFFDMASDWGAPETRQPAVESWVLADPRSPGAALLEASYWARAAWRARGSGYSNTVTPEGWRLFYERLRRASKILDDSESYASANPLWYTQRLDADLGLGVSVERQRAVYERGIEAFPDYYPLHCDMVQGLLPKWGGSNRAVASFIESVSKRSSTATRAQTYTRLWWCVDSNTGLEVNVFRDMGASWTRMKEGFESLNQSYPGSLWNLSKYASFACRAGDMATYRRLRSELGDRINVWARQAFPSNASPDVCDHRAAHGKLN